VLTSDRQWLHAERSAQLNPDKSELALIAGTAHVPGLENGSEKNLGFLGFLKKPKKPEKFRF